MGCQREMMPGFVMGEVPEGTVNPWAKPARIAGEAMGVQGIHIRFLECEHTKFGVLVMGQRPEGYAAWVFRETGGGGAGTVPYTFDQFGRLWVAALSEKRPNMGPLPVLDLIGGFIDPGETHQAAARRETAEETGLDLRVVFKIEGMGINSNRAFLSLMPARARAFKLGPPTFLSPRWSRPQMICCGSGQAATWRLSIPSRWPMCGLCCIASCTKKAPAPCCAVRRRR